MIVLLFLFSTLFAFSSPLTIDGPLAGATRLIVTKFNDDLASVSQRAQVAPSALAKANPDIDFDALEIDQLILVPSHTILPSKTRKGIVINIAERRLFDFTTPGKVSIYSVGVGRENWPTLTGNFTITSKRHLPVWNVPRSVHLEEKSKGNILPKSIPPGPDNPLGAHSMRLSNSSYLIHGTNDPSGIGIPSTSGCVSLFPDDIEQLFQHIPVGTKVEIVNKPIKMAHYKNRLWIESHLDEKTHNNPFPIQKIDDMINLVKNKYHLTDLQVRELMNILNDNTGMIYPLNSGGTS
ncbi:L,D-transpeptidase family protein [Gammaproteobacteria bacterium]|nr:L,D-transpeptidase family protein [Gammaproteobacteria bacterium]